MSPQILVRNAGFSIFQVVVSAAALLLLYRILLQHLSVAEVGLWALITGSTSLARLSDFGLGGGVVRFVALDLGREKPGLAACTIGMAFVSVTVLVAIASLIMFPVVGPWLPFVVPKFLLPEAHDLLLFALVALVIGSASNVFMSALDGFQRMDWRASIQLAGTLGQVGAAAVLLPNYGIVSLGAVQIAQAGFVLLLNAAATAWLLGRDARSVFGWDRPRFGEMVRYGGGLQIAAVGQMLFEPTVKALLAMFGGLALTGYYEMANRMTLQFRSVIVSAYNVMVPYVAGQIGKGVLDRDAIRRAYLKAYRLLTFLAAPYFAAAALILPVLITWWSEKFDAAFITVGFVLLLAWALNTLVAPAYFLYLAMGRLRWTIASQVTIGVLNVLFASLGGIVFGGMGVLWGSVLALVIGGFVTTAAFHLEYQVPIRELFPSDQRLIFAVSTLGIASSIFMAFTSRAETFSVASVVAPLALVTLLLITLCKHRTSKEILKMLLRRG